MAAFGSLALSPDPGTAEMGMLLSISLSCTLFCALIVLPALLGPAEGGGAVGGRASAPPAEIASNDRPGCVKSAAQALAGPESPARRAASGLPCPERVRRLGARADSRSCHGIARDARIMAGIRNRPFGERLSPAAREPRR